MKNTKIAERDFDEWAEMAREDPTAFEKMRLAAINRCIEDAPDEHRERLRRLQWRIDQERRMARTPMNACLRISRMMWDNILGQGGLRERLVELGGLLQGDSSPAASGGSGGAPSATVLAFARSAK